MLKVMAHPKVQQRRDILLRPGWLCHESNRRKLVQKLASRYTTFFKKNKQAGPQRVTCINATAGVLSVVQVVESINLNDPTWRKCLAPTFSPKT